MEKKYYYENVTEVGVRRCKGKVQRKSTCDQKDKKERKSSPKTRMGLCACGCDRAHAQMCVGVPL